MKTILLVEDDREMMGVLNQVLSKEGYLVLTAETGSEAVDIMSCKGSDLVILDLSLPDCSGLDILVRIMEMYENVPVIILTGHGSREAVRRAMEAGAYDFITKPFDIDEVCTVVKETLLSVYPTAG